MLTRNPMLVALAGSRRALLVAGVAALAMVVFAAVAVAGSRDNQHPQVLPSRFASVSELSTVNWHNQANGFVQFLFDRGKITSVQTSAGANSLTVQQGSGTHIWRSQVFMIPATATIRLNVEAQSATSTAAASKPDSWKPVPFSRLKEGMSVRIVQSGPPGSSLQIVRVDATRASWGVPFPTAGGASSTGG
jgi:hypothetical protein